MASIIVIESNPVERDALVDALHRRFGADFAVVALPLPDLPEEALASHAPIAVALAPIGTSDFALLDGLGAHHPGTRRIAVVRVGDTSVAQALGRALTLGVVDYYVGQPWASPEEELYPVVSEALRVWAFDQQLRLEKVTIVDAPQSPAGAELATMLSRNGVTARLLTSDSDDGQRLLAGRLSGLQLPAMRLWDDRVLAAPTKSELAEALGAHTTPSEHRYDVAIVGTGPAGLAASVYAASEGLRTLAIEADGVGGQARTSSKIRNYLGFPWGIRGADLAYAASRQAEQLGAAFVVTRSVVALLEEGRDRVLTLSNGATVRAACVILAGGVNYRLTGIDSVDALVGHGVFYGAAAGEVAAMGGVRIAILGGGNSAAQAATQFASGGAEVTVLIRGESLAKGMSDYLVRQLEGTPSITIRTQVRVVEAIGDGQLHGLVLGGADGTTEALTIDAMFIFIGAAPSTEWLAGTVDLDDRGFVLTGQDGAAWLETSTPGVFAAGDIRAGSIKRVAAAVGEGSTAAMLAREQLMTAAED